MSQNKLIPYNPKLKNLARQLRKNSTLAEVLLWQNIKGKGYGYEFHRQVPIDEFIVDFYCHELRLAIEIDGNTHDYNYNKDEERQKILEGFGISFLRFGDQDVKHNINDVLRAIEISILEIEGKKFRGEGLE
jgi:very-short-patch-repair endonuclease